MTTHGVNMIDPGPTWPAIGHVRLWDCGVTWKHIHTAPGIMDFSKLDAMVDRAIEGGSKNLSYVICATPQWAAKDPNLAHFAPWLGAGSNSAPRDMADWDEFVRALASRYRGQIGSYEIWNEPQLKDFWGYNSYAPLADMTRRARVNIRRADPNARIVAAASLPRHSSGGMTKAAKYLRALADKGWPIDVHNVHVYPVVGEGAAAWRQYVREFRSMLKVLHAPKLPIWVTETNFDLLATTNPLPDGTIRTLMDRVGQIATDEDIFKVYWYAWGHSDSTLLGIPFSANTLGGQLLERYSKR